MRFVFTILVCLPTILLGQIPTSPHISVDQFGYHPDDSKVAVLSNPNVGFDNQLSYSPGVLLEIRNAVNDSVVLTSNPQQWNNGQTHGQSGNNGWWLDFSGLQMAGNYYLFDPTNNVRSYEFEISDNPYDAVLDASLKMFYYNRCNSPKAAPYAESPWLDTDNFLGTQQDQECRDVYDQNNAATAKDLTGGWFDAGDYNKYATFTEETMHNLLWAYRENPKAFTDEVNIPESNNDIPDLIDEIIWELDWLQKMNNPDGSTHIKMGNLSGSNNHNAPPSNNSEPRYYGPTCTSASITVAGVFAHAAFVLSEINGLSAYSQALEDRAIQSWQYALPHLNGNSLELNCDDGSIEAGDADKSVAEQRSSAVVAAIHLFELTGDTTYRNYVINNINDVESMNNGFWGPYFMSANSALLLFTTMPDTDQTTANSIISSITNAATNNWDDFFGFVNADLYRSHMPDWSYHWGSNNAKAAYGSLNILLSRYSILPNDSSEFWLKAREQVRYFHGLNPLNLVYLTSMEDFGAENSCHEIFHGWFADQSAWDTLPAPGFVPGGPNQNYSPASGPNIEPPQNQPQQKSYYDWNSVWPDKSWEITEPAIYYQASYIRLLANFVEHVPMTTSIDKPELSKLVELYPNPVNKQFTLEFKQEAGFDMLRILDANGREVQRQIINPSINRVVLDVEHLRNGQYMVQLISSENTTTSIAFSKH